MSHSDHHAKDDDDATRIVIEPLPAHVNSDHRETLAQIFSHPTSANIEWRRVRSLLEAVGTVSEHRNGKLEVTVGTETEVLQPPRGKDVDRQLLVDLRRLLRPWAPTD